MDSPSGPAAAGAAGPAEEMHNSDDVPAGSPRHSTVSQHDDSTLAADPDGRGQAQAEGMDVEATAQLGAQESPLADAGQGSPGEVGASQPATEEEQQQQQWSPKPHHSAEEDRFEQHEQQEQGGELHAAAGDHAGPMQPDEQQAQHAQHDEEQQAAAQAALEQQQQKLNELEAVLRQADAVMEPGIMERLREYVMANGHPQAAVEYLTDSYVGYAQMASLVCRWLEMSEPEGDSAPAGTAGGAGATAAPGIAGVGGSDHPAAANGAASGQLPAKRQLDEAFYLRQLAKERFDPQHFATVFTSGGSGAPQWLNGLISEPDGRSLVYELAGRYKNSLLLNFAIHKILMQPGREKEVAAVGGSLAGYFGVFHRLMAAKLREAAAAPDEATLAAVCRSLKEDCCAGQHTYVHAQQVLGELAKHPNGARFRRISQELEDHAAALHGPVVWKMRQWFAEPGQPESHYQVASLLSDILAASVSGVPPASEMGKLYRWYWPEDPGQQPPPVAFLRHPRVFEVLLQGLFNPSRQLLPEAVHAYSGLLALAAAADDRRTFGGAEGDSSAGGGQGSLAGGGGEPGLGPPAGHPNSSSSGVSGELDLSAVPATRAALEQAAELARRVMQDHKGGPQEMEGAAAVLEYPCCAAGILRAMSAQLTRPEYWQTAYHLVKSPPFLQLLSLLVPRQPALHASLLSLLGRALTAMGNANHDMAKAFLSVAVQLVSAGRVFEVLRWAEEWKQRADPSLVRHLVFGILEVAAPPYSPDFAGSMLRIMMAAGIRRQRLSARDWAVKALLDEFAAACAQVQFKPPLSAREAQFLQDVSADRPPGY